MNASPCALRRPSVTLAILAASACAVPSRAEPAAGLLRDFSALPADHARSFERWNWTPEQKAAAARFSREDAVRDPAMGDTVLRLSVAEDFPWRDAAERLVSLGATHLPPVADAIRLTVRTVSGRFTISVGGPTVYFGHSDVHAEPVTLSADDGDGWRTVEFDLNRGLRRNFRRAEWAAESPVITYSRWVQEPIQILVEPGSTGELRIARAEWVARGEGRPFPSPAAPGIEPVGRPVGFGASADRARAFTLFTSARERVDLAGPPRAVRPAWIPPRLAFAADEDRTPVLRSAHRGVEEACWTAVRLDGVEGADALRLELRAENPAVREALVLDFMLVTTAADTPFPWDAVAPPAAWRGHAEAFDAYLHPGHPALAQVGFALFHARRVITPGEWTEVLLPMADFLCYYGQGSMAAAFRDQQAPEAARVRALAFLSPYGQRAAETTVDLREIHFVRAPDDLPRQSYAQPAPEAP
jgi:hypothetical protein